MLMSRFKKNIRKCVQNLFFKTLDTGTMENSLICWIMLVKRLRKGKRGRETTKLAIHASPKKFQFTLSINTQEISALRA